MQLVPKTTLASPRPLSRHPLLQPQNNYLDVEGMKCAGCVKVVEQQLTQHPAS